MVEFHLHRAAQDGDLQKMKQLIQEGMFIDNLDDIKYTPLQWTSKCGHLEVAEFLISQKCDLDIRTKDGITAVMLAAECGHKSVVELLLRSGAVAGGCSEIGGWTLLHHAARRGWTDTVRYLVERKDAELDARSTLGMTPLLLAAHEGHVDIIELLIEAGADVNARDQQLGAVLHYAADRGWLQIVKKILSMEAADVDVRNEYGNTPLHIACGMHNKEIVKELLKAGADASAINLSHETALIGKSIHVAAVTGDLERLEYLIQLGVSVDCLRLGYMPLHIAAYRNQLQVGEFLIRHHCNLNPIADNGYDLTPLLIAAFSKHEEFVDLLVKSGADTSVCESSTKTTFLHFASANNWASIIRNILENNDVNVNAKTDDGLTPLLYACDHSNLESTKILLQAGANVQSCDDDGFTPLHYVCEEPDENKVELVETLLLAGADPNRESNDNATPFHLAIEKGAPCINIIKLLIKHGAYFKYADINKLSENNPLKEQVLSDADLCTQLIINKFNRHSLPVVYKNPEYVSKLPRIDKMNIGNTGGVRDGIAACVQSEIETKTYCDVLKIRPTVLTLMCVEALINPQPTKKKRSSRWTSHKNKVPVKRSARIALLKESPSKKISN